MCCGGVLSKHLVFYTGKVGVMSVWSGSIVGMATLGMREVQGSSPGLVEEMLNFAQILNMGKNGHIGKKDYFPNF